MVKLNVNQLIDPLEARVIVATNGAARFDLRGMPRVDSLLIGRPATDIPELVARLCSLCPVTHHLAGMAALDQLAGVRIPTTAYQIRLLLHHGSVLTMLGARLTHYGIDINQARKVVALGQAIQKAVGMTGHFPAVARPGGVENVAINLTELPAMITQVGVLATPNELGEPYSGINVIVSDETGQWDPLGGYLRAYDEHRDQLIAACDVPHWIRETQPGTLAPQPEILFHGQWRSYRVGACARHPGLSAPAAQLHSVQDSLTAVSRIINSYTTGPQHTCAWVSDGTGVGLIDGPRGLLIHHYEVTDGLLRRCTILNPTAQNEPWLAQLLTQAGKDRAAMEAAIRAADPCLPCTAAPPGKMTIEIVEEPCA